MTNETLSIDPAEPGRLARLRADRIRLQDLLQLGRALAAGDQRSIQLLDALEDLGRLADANRRDGELDKALDDVAELARLDDAAMDLTPSDVRQLAEQANAALPALRSVPDAERGAA